MDAYWVSFKQYYSYHIPYAYGYAPVIHLKMAISGTHAHIHTDKTDISW